MDTQLDPQAVNLAKAIRQTESGGNFQAKGKSGEYGAYQFTEPTWKAYSSKYGVTANLADATPEQQNEVAYKQIKEWKDQGHNVGEIASMWNAGEKNKDAYINGNSGVNSSGVKYDTGAYAKSVATAYQTLKNGGQVSQDPNNPSAVQPEGYATKAYVPPVTPEVDSATGEQKPGLIQGAVQGVANATGIPKLVATGSDLLGRGLQIGSQIAGKLGVPGATDFANRLEPTLQKGEKEGVDLGYFGKTTPLGQTGSAMGDLKESLGTGVKVGTTLGSARAAGDILSSVLSKGGTALTSDVTQGVLQKYAGNEAVSNLSNAEKVNALTDAIKSAEPANKIILNKALEEATSGLFKEAGIAPGAAKTILKKAVSGGSGLIWKALKLAGMAEVIRGGKDITSLIEGK